MIQSVETRKKNSQCFHLCYEDLCKLRNIYPLPVIRANIGKKYLDFNGDKLKLNDWELILQALSSDKSLHFIAIRSNQLYKYSNEDINTKEKTLALKQCPVIHTEFVMKKLSKSLSLCMKSTAALTCLELECLFLSTKNITILSQGLLKCQSLQNLSFHKSCIYDEGCEIVCSAVKKMPNINIIDLSGCQLTDKGALSVSNMVKFQQLQRYTESWKENLRGRQVNIDTMPGLRRIILNNNKICDKGIEYLVETLTDDLWLKAIDLQNCDIGNDGGLTVLNMLKSNKSLHIVDLRNNCSMNKDILVKVMEILSSNNPPFPEGKIQQYAWLTLDKCPSTLGNRNRSMSTCIKTVTSNTKMSSSNFTNQNLPERCLLKQKSKSDLTCTKSTKTEVELLEERVKALEIQLKKVKQERDTYLMHLKKIEADQNGYVLIETDAIKVIHQTFEKLSTCFKLLKNNYFVNEEDGIASNDSQHKPHSDSND